MQKTGYFIAQFDFNWAAQKWVEYELTATDWAYPSGIEDFWVCNLNFDAQLVAIDVCVYAMYVIFFTWYTKACTYK